MCKFLQDLVSAFTCFLAVLLIATILWVSSKFGVIAIESIIFHIQHPVGGAPTDYYYSYIKRFVESVGVGVIWFLLLRILQRKSNFLVLKKIFVILPFIFLLGGIFVFITKFNVINYIAQYFSNDFFFEENYTKVSPTEAIFPERKQNVLVIVLESMEDSFYNEDLFSEPIIPNMQRLQQDNQHCSLTAGKNLEWTVASFTGLLFGLPLNLPFDGNKYNLTNYQFLPGAFSLLELFEYNGYSINIIAGSDLCFAGVKNIFLNHALKPNIYDLPFFIEQKIIQKNSITGWGLHDKQLYKEAELLLTDISKKDSPFFVLLNTIDTHSKARSYGDYQQPYGDDRDSFIAADCMLGEFVDWLSMQDFYNNTTILIVGDHPYMNEKLGDVLLGPSRPIYNVFINTINTNEYDPKARQATMLDMGPSLLHSIGVKLPENKFGLGVSIFSEKQTLLEQYGQNRLSQGLGSRSQLYNTFLSAEHP